MVRVRAKLVTVMRSYAQNEVNQGSEQNEVDGINQSIYLSIL